MHSYSTHEGYTRYLSLNARSVFITGGATGIGAALVEAFAAQGAKVAFESFEVLMFNEARVRFCNSQNSKSVHRNVL